MNPNICIVSFPLAEAGYTPLSNLVKLFSKISNKVYVVSGGAALEKLENTPDINACIIKVTHKVSSNPLMRIINYMCIQLKILHRVIRVLNEVDLFVFFIGGEGLILSTLVLKFLRKKILLMPGGTATKVYSVRKDPLARFVSLLISINTNVVDRLVLYSPRLIQEGKFERYRSKIVFAHEHFINFNKFMMKKKIDERLNILGYIGRLSEEKGILNLIDAIPLISEKKADLRFIICGDGHLADEVEKRVKTNGLEEFVKLVKWVSHEEVPQYLNELKLLVLPSFTEGLPNVLLEAMACGTPVLATPVGAIPDIVKEGETGFLLKSNDSKHMAERVIEILGNSEILEKVSINAYNYVRENFSYEKTLETWQKFLINLGKIKT